MTGCGLCITGIVDSKHLLDEGLKDFVVHNALKIAMVGKSGFFFSFFLFFWGSVVESGPRPPAFNNSHLNSSVRPKPRIYIKYITGVP